MSVGYAQEAQFTGIVKDVHGHLIPGAHVKVNPGKQVAVTDTKGEFSFKRAVGKEVFIQISFLGFNTLKDTLVINRGINQKNYRLHSNAQNIDELIIAEHKNVEHNSLDNVELSKEFLERFDNGTFVNNLERIPGINAMNIGVGIAKPVIRGLSSNRVQVNVEGSKQEGQQWGSDHGLEIDQFDVKRVEIIKGPATLVYGSDGLGGVINILPEEILQDGEWKMDYRSIYKSNNDYFGNSIGIGHRKSDIFFNARASFVTYGDYQVPATTFDYNTYILPIHNSRLKNTSGRERNVAAEAGIVKKWGTSRIKYSRYELTAGLFSGAMGIPNRNNLADDGDRFNIDNPRQKIVHNRLNWNTVNYMKKGVLKWGIAYQNNDRKELSDPHSHDNTVALSDLAIGLELETVTWNVKYELDLWENYKWSIGANGLFQNNNIGGFEFLIPAYRSNNNGVFAIVERNLSGRFSLTAGIRGDYAVIQTESFRNRSIENSTSYLNFAGSLGANYNLNERWGFKLNFGKSFRNPSIAELMSDGIHHGTFRHERGDRNIESEHGYQLDLVVDYSVEKLQLKVAGFYNFFQGFIYLSPTAHFSNLPEGGQVYLYKQNDAVYTGGEISFNWTLTNWLKLTNSGELVWNQNLDTELPLPFTPATSTLHGVVFSFFKQQSLKAGIDFKNVWEQNRVDRNEGITDGYSLLNCWINYKFQIKQVPLTLQLEARNILDTKYMNHLSRYRILNLPEQGRNFVLTLKIPLHIKSNKK